MIWDQHLGFPADSPHEDLIRFTGAEVIGMETALTAARLGVRSSTPLAGAVILDADGTVLAIGHHLGAGTPHAVVDVITRLLGTGVKRDLSAATIIVTLEPCVTDDPQGSCAHAIVDAGIGNVIFAVAYPQKSDDSGAQVLRREGINVRSGLMQDEAQDMNRQWFIAVKAQRPFVTARLAQTIDSRIAAADGSNQWITSVQSRRDSHTLRSRVDAIVVGTGTVLFDNPRLTARDDDGQESASQPLRVVMGTRAIGPDAAVRQSTSGEFLQLATHDPNEVLAELHQRGIGHVMIEGGSMINAAFLQAALVDELVVYLAPTLLGAGVSALNDIGIGTLALAQQWEWDATTTGPVETMGPDLKLTLMPTRGEAASSQQA